MRRLNTAPAYVPVRSAFQSEPLRLLNNPEWRDGSNLESTPADIASSRRRGLESFARTEIKKSP